MIEQPFTFSDSLRQILKIKIIKKRLLRTGIPSCQRSFKMFLKMVQQSVIAAIIIPTLTTEQNKLYSQSQSLKYWGGQETQSRGWNRGIS